MKNNFDKQLEKNGEYWKNRFEKLEENAVKKGADYYESLDKEYRKAEKAINAKINVWYQRFANNNEISLSEARKLLNSDELEEFKWSVEEYIKYGQENAFTQEWMKELENASAKVHISRLESLKLQMQQEVEVLYGNQLDGIDKLARNIYTDGYYHTAFEIQKGFNVGWDFASIDSRRLEKVISKPWTADGKTFSDKLWTQKNDLISTLHTELTQGIMRGSAPDKAIQTISNKFKVAKSKAGRLVMTESAYFASASQEDCFNELGVERFEIVATLDSSTSELCRSLDGKVQDMKDFEPGVTAPPFHPWCRTTTVPYFDDDFGERAARDADGKTYYVPSNMKYKEWKNGFVGGDKSGLEEIVPEPIKNEPKFFPAKTIEEAERFAHSQGVKYVEYGKLPLETINDLNEALTTLPKEARPIYIGDSRNYEKAFYGTQHKLPRKHDSFYGVSQDSSALGMYFKDENGIYRLNLDEGGQMVGISSVHNTAEKITTSKIASQKKYREKYGRDWFFNETGKTTAVHEMGHVYVNVYGLPEGFEYASRTWAEKSKCDMLKNPSEAWAEAWASYHTGINVDRVPEDVLKYIKIASEK